MSKKLIIDECKQCPHFESWPIQNSDNQFTAVCCNPRLDEQKEWITKIHNIVTPPPFCPLEDYGYEDEL